MGFDEQIVMAEKERRVVYPLISTPGNISRWVAHEIAKTITNKACEAKKCVLGLATGSTPIKIYEELIRLNRENGLSFKNVVTFNLDEYYGLEKDDKNSYWKFMHKHLFDHIDILPENIYIPSGTVGVNKVNEYCSEYEEQIKDAGGIDIQLLGIGRTGHIGFNEPGSKIFSTTRLVTLNEVTRVDAAPAFDGIDHVPDRAITMGVKTILNARKVFLFAWGKSKARVVKQALEGTMNSSIPASFQQTHKNASVFLDKDAASELEII